MGTVPELVDRYIYEVRDFLARRHKQAGRTSINPRLPRRQLGLRKLSPDLISKARDETTTQVTRIGLTFVGTTTFCLLSLLSPDSALLGGSERINVPLGIGPVSFVGFMLLGPAVLILLRVYLQMYVEHSLRLHRLARSISGVRAPTFVPFDNPIIRRVSGMIFYALLPVAILLFAWKAAVFPNWAMFLVGVAVAVTAMMLLWKYKWGLLLSLFAGIIAGLSLGHYFANQNKAGILPQNFRPFNLYRANLSGRLLMEEHLLKADLREANCPAPI